MLDFLHRLFTGDTAVMGQNLSMLVGGLLVCLIYARFYRRTDDVTAKRMALGIALVAGSLAFHRGYWFLWRFFRAIGDVETAHQFEVMANWLGIPVAGILVGYLIHIEPYARRVVRRIFGDWEPAFYWPCMIGVVVVLHIIGAAAGIALS